MIEISIAICILCVIYISVSKIYLNKKYKTLNKQFASLTKENELLKEEYDEIEENNLDLIRRNRRLQSKMESSDLFDRLEIAALKDEVAIYKSDSVYYRGLYYKGFPNRNTTNNIDATTKKLITLALNNPNENEARNAAMKACKKIGKLL